MNNVINNLKSLGIDMINKAGSGHPGIVLSSAPIIYTIYANHMHINPKDVNWINRDRFVLSAGHGSALLYACLYMLDFITLKDLKEFRQIGSVTPGHPEYKVTPGVDMTTGPLGQGLASAVGMAMGAKHMKEKFKDANLIDYYIYVLCGDGDLMEGISYEAGSLAGTLNLDNLIVLYDSNNMSLDGSTNITFDEDVRERFDAMGWYTTLVRNGNNVNEIDRAIKRAKKSGLPSLIEVKTILGDGSLKAGTNEVHGKPLDVIDIQRLKENLNIPDEEFYVDEEAKKEFCDKVSQRSGDKYIKWSNDYQEYINGVLNGQEKVLQDFFSKRINFNIRKNPFEKIGAEAPRDSGQKIINFLADQTDLLFGGSADLFSSSKNYIIDGGDFSKENYGGRNIWFGVREHAMGAILNGLALSGYLSYGSTFLTFADYLKPAIRMSALMDLPVTYIFTHDAINVGEDGPTHQPIEQLASLRAIPNFTVYRPADFKETLGSFLTAMQKQKPCAIVLSRQKLPVLDGTEAGEVKKGAYIVKKEENNLQAVLIATGSEVSVAYDIALDLEQKGYGIRVVSMPSLELFDSQTKKYRYSVLPVGVKTFVIEAGSSFGLRKLVSNEKYLITLDMFGKSGQSDDVLKAMNFSKKQIKNRISKLL